MSPSNLTLPQHLAYSSPCSSDSSSAYPSATCSNSSASAVSPAPANGQAVCIGIGGGVGPAAGVMLHRKIIEATVGDGTDQSHCEVHHISRPGVADRTAFLLGESHESPAVGMAKTMAALAESAQASGKITAVAGVPCNTFHAPKIWNEFVGLLEEQGTSNTVKVVHMLEETVAAIKELVPGATKIGLLSTTGTRTSRVYHELLEPEGITVVQVDPAMQPMVHDAIYNKFWGVKAVQPTTDEAQHAFQLFASELVDRGAQAIILGCTEIPLALPEPFFKGAPLIDPMAVLARTLVTRAGALASSFNPPASPVPTSVSSAAGGFSGGAKPKWQQHAAAFVIQSHWRAHVAVKAAHRPMISSSGASLHEDYFRAALGSSPAPSLEGVEGLTPELFTPTVVSGMLRVASADVLMT